VTAFTDPSTVALIYVILKYWAPTWKSKATDGDSTDDNSGTTTEESDGTSSVNSNESTRASGRPKGGFTFLDDKVVASYEHAYSEVGKRMKTDTAKRWDDLWINEMKRKRSDSHENNDRRKKQKKQSTAVLLASGGSLFGDMIEEV